MTVCWCALVLLCSLLNSAESSSPSSVVQGTKYKNSFRLTRSTRNRVQQLLEKYKVQQLGEKHFEDREHQLPDLPLISTDFYRWLQLTDLERLRAAFRDMHSYWNMLEWKRKQLEREESGQVAARLTRNTLPQSIKYIQLDLRDLMSQVSSQMRSMKNSWVKPMSPTRWTPLNPSSNAKTVWDSRVEGYVILRDLDLYLTKLARDFLLLASKTHI